MPLYFFDLYDGGTATRDEFGVDLGSVDEAADQAAALLPDLARDRLVGESSRDFATFVRDDGGSLVHRAALLYRAQTLDRGAAHAPRPSHADDLIMQSREILMRSKEIRQKTREIVCKLDSNVYDLLGVIVQSTDLYEDSVAVLNRS